MTVPSSFSHTALKSSDHILIHGGEREKFYALERFYLFILRTIGGNSKQTRSQRLTPHLSFLNSDILTPISPYLYLPPRFLPPHFSQLPFNEKKGVIVLIDATVSQHHDVSFVIISLAIIYFTSYGQICDNICIKLKINGP